MHEDKRPARFAIVGVLGEEREQLAARAAEAGGNLVHEERPGQRFERARHQIGQRQAGGHAKSSPLAAWARLIASQSFGYRARFSGRIGITPRLAAH